MKFLEDNGDRPTLVKHVPTQKYNRKEIQKRLDIENWMEEQLKELYQSEVCRARARAGSLILLSEVNSY